ncbi:MAG: hypothetical protein ACRYGA_02000 [Janthinobacterium lividum]
MDRQRLDEPTTENSTTPTITTAIRYQRQRPYATMPASSVVVTIVIDTAMS